MDLDEIEEIFSDDDDGQKALLAPPDDRRTLLTPLITRVVDALGGYEADAYRLGDECYGCLKDLKRLWRKDDTDDDRTVARIFYESRLLSNDLVPVLMATAGKGLVEDKRAIACVDLMTAMTWPIDVAEELKEMYEEQDEAAAQAPDYTQLLHAHLQYKATLAKPEVVRTLFALVLPPLAKTPAQREERDGQIINVVLHLIRNLAFIKDLPPNTTRSADNVEYSSLQGRMVRVMEETHVLKLLLTIAANTGNDPLFNTWNALVLEIFYLLFRGVKPLDLTIDQNKRSTATLQRLLAVEDRNRLNVVRKASSRHSRFGTTVTVQLKKPPPPSAPTDPSTSSTETPTYTRPVILHRQQAITAEAGTLLDIRKQAKAAKKKSNVVDALARDDNLSLEARQTLQNLANDFLEGCFNPFLQNLLKDIRSERAKISEKDSLRLLYVAKWFLEYFLGVRAKEVAAGEKDKDKDKDTGGASRWHFGLVAEVVERGWVVWVLKRMREAIEEKPKAWTELQVGIECLTQLLLLIDAMSASTTTTSTSIEELHEASAVLYQQLIYNGEILDIALDSLKSYKEGKQSLAYLDAAVGLGYVLLRGLERSGRRGGEGYVRKKGRGKGRGGKGRVSGRDVVPETEEAELEDGDESGDEEGGEVVFSFEGFEMKFANIEITNTLLTYLARYKEFGASPEKMKRVVNLLHRQAVRAKAEGLFFKVSTLDLFKTLLSEQKGFPREQPYKDLVNLINFILRKFFKAVEEEPFLTIEAFFPKNRGNWKQYSSWEPEEKEKAKRGEDGENGRAGKGGTRNKGASAAELYVKKGYSWSDQLGIAISALVDTDRKDLVVWVQDLLRTAINKRQRIIDETDRKEPGGGGDGDEEEEDVQALMTRTPTEEARKRITDEVVPYLDSDQAEAASKNAYLKLLFRLCKFAIQDEEDEEIQWYIPADLMPSVLEQTRNVILQFLETPYDPQGSKIASLLKKKQKRRRRRSPSLEAGDEEGDDSDGNSRRKRKRKEKEVLQYKSAQFIEDSDEEYGDMEAFFEKEKEMREKAALAAVSGNADGNVQGKRPVGMRATGTKKRKRGKKGKDVAGDDDDLVQGGGARGVSDDEQEVGQHALSSSADSDSDSGARRSQDVTRKSNTPPPPPRPRPKPRPKKKSTTQESSPSNTRPASPLAEDDADPEPVLKRRTKRLVLSDSDED
ncbi:timeless-domain-containing protein [Coprinopsis marcescibilis]|uniref:Timeless-domain-containing protein n=1 Tax=Coprinopsis marcescibilis TaxID=230819 RepID=A0A5C3L6D9_COPMA|nr:timeless-domain-containing protein [Coprinopsis marcescibilis]